MKIKKMAACVLFTMIFVMEAAVHTLGMENIPLPFSDDTVTVCVTTDIPDGFQEDIEIYLNGSPYYMTSASGYRLEIGLEPEEYSVRVLCYGDLSGRYSFLAPERLDAAREQSISITVLDNWEDSQERESHVLDEDAAEGWEEFEPELIDLSDGRPYGTILITSETYGAVKSASYCLVGVEKVYEITLKNEYAGCARVLLPVGNYYESGTMHIELAENAAAPEGTAFLWQHKDNMGIWGDYYQVEEGKTIEINDLMIMMAVDGDMAELHSNALFSKTMIENREYLMESHYQKELESAFPESREESQGETIASAEPMTEPPVRSVWEVIPIFIGIVVIIAVVFFAFWIRRRNRSLCQNRF